MLRTFNMGIGLILVVAAGDADAVIGALRAAGEPDARVIGAIAAAAADALPPSATRPDRQCRWRPGASLLKHSLPRSSPRRSR